jgi:DNA-binding MarR family transcriptional regulator/GNAT superfamily N-acetyltransferase
MLDAGIRQVRSFNRTVTEAVGALDDHFLGRDRPLGEARFLWEIGDGGADVRELRRLLGLDSGYTSRLLRSLERQGLVAVGPSPTDARMRRVTLTPAGRSERRELDRRAEQRAASLVTPLTPDERGQLIGAMRSVERLLIRSQTTIGREPASSPDVRWCFRQYVEELDRRFDTGFEATRSIPARVSDFTPPTGFVLLVRLHDQPVGCCAVRFHEDAVAEIKRMWLSPRLRGYGLGARVLRETEREAAAGGATVARLETNRHLVEAIAMYRRHGYREVAPFSDDPYADFWFEKPLKVDS